MRDEDVVWVSVLDDIEKEERIVVRHPRYELGRIRFDFKHLLEFGQERS